MNILIGALGANLTIGFISSITSATTGICSVVDRIRQSSAVDIKRVIDELDIELTVKMIQCMISEINLDQHSPATLQVCLKGLIDCLKEITDELAKICYRLQYNESLWLGQSIRGYGFENCHARLRASMKRLENRKNMLLQTLSVKDSMYRNKQLENVLSQSILAINSKTFDQQQVKEIGTSARKLLTKQQDDQHQ
jgi:hypothetical protein